jgi:hypothetical protein
MPNHVTNRIEFYGEQKNIDTILEIIKGDKECIDFEKIIPMPEDIYRGDLGPDERAKYGKNNWYDWRCFNWGTKWNAYYSSIDKENNAIEFDTAWSCPLALLDELAKICYEHNVSFDGKWADEDCGHSVGVFESDCDSDEYWFSYEYVTSESSEAYEIYQELKGETDCLGKDEDGNWVHYDCDTCPNRDKC